MIEKLIDAAPDRLELQTVHGVTRFWIAVRYSDDQKESPNPTVKASAHAQFVTEITHAARELGDVVSRGESRQDALLMLADAYRWADAETERGLEIYTKLDAATRNLEWQYRNYSWLIVDEKRMVENTKLNPNEDPLHTEAPWLPGARDAKKDLATVLNVLTLGVSWHRITALDAALRGEGLQPSDWGDLRNMTYVLGFVAGRQRGLSRIGGRPTKCEQLASAPWDHLRRSPGIAFDDIRMDKAIDACDLEHSHMPDDAGIDYLFGRVTSGKQTPGEKGLRALQAAALKDYPGGWNGLTFYAEKAMLGREIQNSLRYGMAQRVFLEVFPTLYPKLNAMTLDGHQQEAVHGFAELAAEFGSVDAHLALAETAISVADRLFHILAAKKLANGKRLDAKLIKRFKQADMELAQSKNTALGIFVAARLKSVPEKIELQKLPENIVGDILGGFRKNSNP